MRGGQRRAFALLYTYGVLFDVLGYSRRDGDGRATDASGAIYLGAFTGLGCSTLLALASSRHTDPLSYALLLGTLSAFFLAIRAASDFLPFLLPPAERVTDHLPITARTQYAARLAVLGTLVAIQFLNWNLPVAIVAGFAFGGIRPAAAYFLAMLLLACATSGAVLVVHLLALRALGSRRVREALVYIQVLATAIVLLAIFGLPKLAGASEVVVVELLARAGLAWPPGWFAHLFAALAGRPFDALGVALACGAVLLPVLPLVLVARSYEGVVRSHDAPASLRTLAAPFDSLLHRLARRLVPPSERPFFLFAAINFRRDRGFRLRVYPLLVYPIAILVLAGKETPDHYYVTMLQVVALYMMLIVAFIRYTDHPRAAWLLDVLPIRSGRELWRGVERAFVWTFLVPAYALIGVALCFVWRPLEALAQTLLAALVALAFIALAFRRQRELPFSDEFRGQLGPEASAGGLMGFTLVLAAVGLAQYVCGRTVLGYLAMAGLAVAITRLVRRTGGAEPEPSAAGDPS